MSKIEYLLFLFKRRLLRLLGLSKSDIHYIGGAQTLPEPLSKHQEAQALAALERGDESGRDLLIVHNLRLVVYIARKFENTGVGIEDLISIGTVGLIKAVNTFSDEVSRDLELRDEQSRLLTLVNGLDAREKEIMTLRFGLFGSKEYTQKQVADQLGISQSYISRLEKRIIARLKEELTAQET